MTREPSEVVTATGSYHSKLLVACRSVPISAYNSCRRDERYPVMKVSRFPIGVVPRIKGTAVSIEFIGKNKDHLAAVLIRLYIVRLDGRVLVN